MDVSSKQQDDRKFLRQGFALLNEKLHLLTVSLIFLFFLALAIRLYKVETPSLIPAREFHSAFFARAFFYDGNEAIQDWQREAAFTSKERLGTLEPPILEFLVAAIYDLVGGEHLWIAKMLTAIFWVISGFFFYKLARKLMPEGTAVFVTGYYLLVPLGIITSRSFQPESFMMMWFLASLLAILHYYEQPTSPRLFIAAILTGVCLLVKPLPIFTLFAVFTSLAINHHGTWKRVVDRSFLLFIGLSLLPSILYYGYGLFAAGFLFWKVGDSFRPWLLLHQEYWRGWYDLAVGGVGYTALLVALLGMPLQGKGKARTLVVALWLGYFVFGLVFNFHIHTHGYYHVQLIPIVALSFAPVVTIIISHLQQEIAEWYWWLPVAGVIGLMLFFSLREVRNGLNAVTFESVALAREVGDIVNHSSRVVHVARQYGLPLEYYGEFSGAFWPKAIEVQLYRYPGEKELSIEERLEGLGFTPEYFVITDFNGFEQRHPDLKAFLAAHCTPIATSKRYLIYDGNCL